MKDKLVVTVSNGNFKCTILKNYSEIYNSKLLDSNNSDFLLEDLFGTTNLSELNLENKMIVLLESGSIIKHQINLPKMPKNKAIKVIQKEITSIYGDIKNYMLDTKFVVNEKKYFNIFITLIDKNTVNKVKTIFKPYKLTFDSVYIINDIYQPIFDIKDSFVVFNKDKLGNTLSMKHKNEVRSVSINQKFTESEIARGIDILIGQFKLNESEVKELQYVSIYNNDSAFKDKMQVFNDSWQFISNDDFMRKLRDYANKNKGIKL